MFQNTIASSPVSHTEVNGGSLLAFWRASRASFCGPSFLKEKRTQNPSTMPTPTKIHLTAHREKRILESLLQELTETENKTSFLSVCNSDTKTFGRPGDPIRSDCQKKRLQFQKLLKRSPDKFIALLQSHGLSMPTMSTTRRSEEPTEVEDDMQQTPKKKMSSKAPSVDKETKSKSPKVEPSNLGKWIVLANGQDCYADRIYNVSIDPMDCGLTPHVDLVQHLPAVRFDTTDAHVKAECFSLMISAELADIEKGLVTIHRTTTKNAVALSLPALKSSLRADLEESDQPEDQRKKLLAASRNFKVRNPKTKKLDRFWVAEAWEEHETVLSTMQQEQREDGNEFAVAMRIILLVFPSHVEFSCKVFPQNEDDSGCLLASSEGYKIGNQQIARLRWLLPTSNTTTIRKKVKRKEVNDLADRITQGFGIDDDEDDEDEGMMI